MPLSALAAPPGRSIDDTGASDFIETTERNEDPLGIDQGMQGELESAAERGARRAEEAAQRPALTSRQGQVVSAIGAVRESQHEALVRWAQGLERVEVRIELESQSRFAAEVAYRLALPGEETRVLSVALCEQARCRQARPTSDALAHYEARLARRNEEPVPALIARRIVDARGPALALRVAPLQAGGRLELRVEYGLAAPVRGGVVRLRLPGRGFDPRTASTEVRIEAPDLTLPEGAGPFTLDAWLPLELPLRFAPRDPAARHGSLTAAGAGRRVWRAAPLEPEDDRPLTLWVFVDRSASMEGPARGRVVPALSALRAGLSAGSRMRVAVFDDAALPLGGDPQDAGFEGRLRKALMQPSGAKTRLSSALALARGWKADGPPVRVVVLSDGRLSTEQGELSAARRFRRRGIPLWLVGLELDALDPKRAALLEALGGRYLPAAAEGERAVHEKMPGPLREKLSRVLHGHPDGRLAPGEQHVEHSPAGRRTGAAEDPALARLLSAQHEDVVWSTLSAGDDGLWPHDQPPAPAEPYLDAPPANDEAATGMPAESVLGLLRDQLVPKARACLRRDRRGRADYAVHAAFSFRLERREILDAEIEGELEPALRRCLRDVLAELRVPAFTGRLHIRYPIYTERAPEPPQVKLEPDTAARIERLFEHRPPP